MLKEEIKDYPDDARIYLDGRQGLLEGEEILYIKCIVGHEKHLVLQSRDDVDVGSDLDSAFEWAIENNISEEDLFYELGERGYTLDDFDYDKEKYEWVKEFSKNHAW